MFLKNLLQVYILPKLNLLDLSSKFLKTGMFVTLNLLTISLQDPDD
jgi:hypothetical protein